MNGFSGVVPGGMGAIASYFFAKMVLEVSLKSMRK